MMKLFDTYLMVMISAFLLAGCESLESNMTAPMESSLRVHRVLVFPFQDPYYKGRQIQGIGGPFAATFANALQLAGVSADFVRSADFQSFNPIESKKACEYARENGYEMLITGVVTEWIDGATEWSGRVDIAALTVSIYNSTTCKLTSAASGRQTGNLITFVNAPTTRFYKPLSKKIVEELLNQ